MSSGKWCRQIDLEKAINLQLANIRVVFKDIDSLVLLTALTPNKHDSYFQKPPSVKQHRNCIHLKALKNHYQNADFFYMLSLVVTQRQLFSIEDTFVTNFDKCKRWLRI